MNRIVRNAILRIGFVVEHLMTGHVTPQHDRSALRHALLELEEDTLEQTMGREAELMKQAEDKIVSLTTDNTSLKLAKASSDEALTAEQAKTADLQKQLDAANAKLATAGSPADPATIKDPADIAEEASLEKLLNQPAVTGGGTSGASAPLGA